MDDTKSDYKFDDDNDENSAEYLSSLTDVGKKLLIGYITSSFNVSSTDISSSIDEIGINTSLEDFKFDPISSCLENVNDITKGYLIDAATAALGLSSPSISYSIGEIDFKVELDGIDISTPLGDYKLDPKASCTENLTDAIVELLGNSVDGEIDQFCSDFNDAAHIEIDTSFYSDGTDTLLSCKINADINIGQDGVQTSAHADGCLSKHTIGETDVNFGQGQVYAKASIGADGVKYVVGGELNVVSLKNENIQANIGLSTKTGVDFTTNNVSASVVGLGVNVGTNGIGISTPVGSFNGKFWE